MYCATCKWFAMTHDSMTVNGADTGPMGQCRKNPPSNSGGMGGFGPFGSAFPTVKTSDFCGAYEQKGV